MAKMKARKYPILDMLEVPLKVIESWQETANLLAEIAGIPSALIMRVHAREIEVFITSHSEGNVYHHGEKAPLDTGLYCESVMGTQCELLVPNALNDPAWDQNPGIKLGMISYLGLPLIWPTGEIFGTICILDKQENAYSQRIRHLMARLRDSIQFSLQVIYNASAGCQQAEEEVRRAHDALELHVQERISELAITNASLLVEITERKKAEALLVNERALLRTLVDHLPVSIYLKDSAGRKTLANPVNLRNSGVADESDVIGRTDFDFFPPEQAAAFHADDMQVLDTGQPVLNREEMLTRPDGTTVWNMTSKVPLTDSAGHVIGLAGIGLDITEIRKAEESLRELNRQLEKEKARAEDLAAKAEASNRAKSEFLSIMSHELRTPLNGVLGFAQLLSDTPLDSEQKDYAKTISNSGEHLLALVSDILDFSSIDAGALAIHVAPLAVAELVKGAVDIVRKTAAAKGLELRCDLAAGVPEQITGDDLRIRQILINLLGNAVKFTASGSVVLRVATASDGGRRSLNFCIEDTGLGISSETLARLFQPFVQADSKKNRRFGGTGLGLAISKRLAEAMGGSITVASTPGKGSTFTFRFPLESAPVRAGGIAAVPSPISDREGNKSALTQHRPPVQTGGSTLQT